MGVVTTSLCTCVPGKSFENLYSLVFSPGKSFETSRQQKFWKVQKFIQQLQGKTLRNLEKQKCSKFTSTARKCLYIVGKVHWTGLQASVTHQKVVSETRDCANFVDGLRFNPFRYKPPLVVFRIFRSKWKLFRFSSKLFGGAFTYLRTLQKKFDPPNCWSLCIRNF